MALRNFTVSSKLSAAPDTVWQHAISPSGVNREFQPLLRMTFPAGASDISRNWEPGKRLFRSWILFAGIFPLECDNIVFEEVEPGHRFLERSSMLTQRVWEHERVIEPCSQGCRVSDRVCFESRLKSLEWFFLPVFKATFRWRHRKLLGLFGAQAA